MPEWFCGPAPRSRSDRWMVAARMDRGRSNRERRRGDESQLGRAAPAQCRQLKAQRSTSSGRKGRSFSTPHGALRSSGCVGGLLGRSVRPQTGRVDPARHSFVWAEVRQNSPFRHADGVEWTRSQGRVERLVRPLERAIESVNVTIKNLQNHNLGVPPASPAHWGEVRAAHV